MTELLTERPWTALPVEAATVLRPELPGLADAIVEAISVGVPDYARDLEGPFGKALRTGVEEALRQFVDLVERGDPERGAGRQVYVGLGRGEMRAGRSLDALLAAYRLGARVAWRRLASAGEAAGLEPRTLYLLAESIFAYIDELSGESIEGYAMEQAAAAGELQRLRRRLAGLLIQDPPADAVAVEAAALAAGWALPAELAAVVTEGDEPDRAGDAPGDRGDRRCTSRRTSARWCPIPTRRAAAPSSQAAFEGRLGVDRAHGRLAQGGRERGPRDGHARPGT